MSSPKPVILAVDDDQPTLMLMRALLREFGFEPLTASSGPEALEAVRRRRPRLVLVDRFMPGMSGEELIGRLRADAGLASVPILILSGAPMEPDDLKKSGADGSVQKPFDIPALIEQIKSRL